MNWWTDITWWTYSSHLTAKLIPKKPGPAGIVIIARFCPSIPSVMPSWWVWQPNDGNWNIATSVKKMGEKNRWGFFFQTQKSPSLFGEEKTPPNTHTNWGGKHYSSKNCVHSSISVFEDNSNWGLAVCPEISPSWLTHGLKTTLRYHATAATTATAPVGRSLRLEIDQTSSG